MRIHAVPDAFTGPGFTGPGFTGPEGHLREPDEKISVVSGS
jgi:hypothetical protein